MLGLRAACFQPPQPGLEGFEGGSSLGSFGLGGGGFISGGGRLRFQSLNFSLLLVDNLLLVLDSLHQ